MTVRAKFFVCRVGQTVYGGGKPQTEIELQAVGGGSEENKQFFQYTPSGNIKLGVLNEAAAAQFSIGQEFYVDFTPAP